MTEGFQFTTKFQEIVDLAIKDNGHFLLRIRHRLMTSRGAVDDRKPALSQTDVMLAG